jgi:CRISPR/Cas system CSM-associated protein Csm4 (group 5 of RAMP superfamily)
VVIWYIFPHFGILYQEKSGNPGGGEEFPRQQKRSKFIPYPAEKKFYDATKKFGNAVKKSEALTAQTTTMKLFRRQKIHKDEKNVFFCSGAVLEISFRNRCYDFLSIFAQNFVVFCSIDR